ncbi:MAG: metal-dependent hydrolase [Pseudomonadota bacterium]
MPFTPLHMGPAIVIKTLAQKRFSLMVFGWSQIVIDVQPLVVLLTNKGHLHGFTHTYIGATLIALFCALSGKYLGEIGLDLIKEHKYLPIHWATAFISAFIGTYSHVFLDSIMHDDIQPFWPFSLQNNLNGIISIHALHIFCLATAIIGSVFFFIFKKYDDKNI